MDHEQSDTIYARRIPVLGKVRQKEGTYYIEEHAVCNQAVGFLCPQCNKPVIVKPMVPGRLNAECRYCHARVAFIAEQLSDITIISKQSPSSQPESFSTPSPDAPNALQDVSPQPSQLSENEPSLAPALAKLSWGHWRKRQEAFLHEGVNLIGRVDKKHSSDIGIDDTLVSVRSVEIKVTLTSAGYEYRLKVLRATNPVFVNGIVVPKGGVVRLTHGADIKMGGTVIKFKMIKY
ncbi:MAG: FHA domain-containing protein [Prevotella sp.]|nr:FHA domain-containing protein [Prevotella sp.]